MKKSIIVIAILLAIIATLPVIGNSFMKKTVDTRVDELSSFGLKVKNQSIKSSYLSTQRHFEFLLQDSEAFVEYLSKYSNQQIPPYVNAMLKGVVVGADIKYNNLPFSKAITVELYPLSLSKEFQAKLQKEDPKFEIYLSEFLESKGVLYHISYNLLNDKFKGYIKDIETSYDFNKELKIAFDLKGATFKGEGKLIAPQEINSMIKSFHVDLINQKEILNIDLVKLSSKSKFDSKNSYETEMELHKLVLHLNGTQSDTNVTMKDLDISASSNDTKVKSELESRVSFKEFHIDVKENALNMKKFLFEVKVDGLDKNKFEVFRSIASKNDLSNSRKYQKDVQTSLIKLLEKGLTIDIKKFSIKDVEIAKIGDIKGFDIKTKIIIKEDPSLTQKMALSPLMAIGDIDVHTKMKINKKMYSYMMQNPGMLIQLNKYAKEDGKNVVFEIDFVDSKMSINGEALN